MMNTRLYVHIAKAVYFVVCILLFLPTAAQAATVNEVDAIISQPQTRITIPGLNFTDPEDIEVQQDASGRNTYITIPYIGEFVRSFYQLAIILIGIASVVMIIIAGAQWIASGGNVERITAAKNRILGAVTGLILAISAYTILYTISPNLVQFRGLRLLYVSEQSVHNPENDNIVDFSGIQGVTKPTWNHETFDCDNLDQYTGKEFGVLPKEQTALFNCLDQGVLKPFRIHKDLGESVCDIGETLMNLGYRLDVQGSYRSFDRQVELWCGEGKDRYPDTNRRRSFYAVPGYSKHGIGVAIDVVLADANGNRVYPVLNSQTQCNLSPEDVRKVDILAKAFYDADWKRLNTEVWHFEYGTSGSVSQYYGLPAKCQTGP